MTELVTSVINWKLLEETFDSSEFFYYYFLVFYLGMIKSNERKDMYTCVKYIRTYVIKYLKKKKKEKEIPKLYIVLFSLFI